jgi:hypothetical protein
MGHNRKRRIIASAYSCSVVMIPGRFAAGRWRAARCQASHSQRTARPMHTLRLYREFRVCETSETETDIFWDKSKMVGLREKAVTQICFQS